MKPFKNVFGSSGFNHIGTLLNLPEANNFIAAAGITDSVQKIAIQKLVRDLKVDGTYDKIKVLYPFVGGTATSHKFNLKNPTDSDAAFRLQFNGTWTHDANGARGVTSAWANTYLFPSNLSTTNYGWGSYRDQYTSGTILGTDKDYELGNTPDVVHQNIAATPFYKVIDGCVVLNKRSSTKVDNIFNGALSSKQIIFATTRGTSEFLIGKAFNSYYFVGRMKFFEIHEELTLNQSIILSSAIINFQKNLSRSVGETINTINVGIGETFTTVRDALKSITYPHPYNKWVINVKNGTYNEIDIYSPLPAGLDPSIVRIAGESKEGVIIKTDGNSTENSPADYQYGSYSSVSINTIPLANKHVFWIHNSISVENCTIHAIDCQYVIHQDNGEDPWYIRYSNVHFIQERTAIHPTSVLGIGSTRDCYCLAENCTIEYRTTLQSAHIVRGIFWHNVSNGKGGASSMKLLNCNFINCGYLATYENVSTFDDTIEINDCVTDKGDLAILYHGTNTSQAYNISIVTYNTIVENVVLENRPLGLDHIIIN